MKALCPRLVFHGTRTQRAAADIAEEGILSSGEFTKDSHYIYPSHGSVKSKDNLLAL